MPAKKKKAPKTFTTKPVVAETELVDTESLAEEVTVDAKTIAVVILLVFFYPIGVILMWLWMRYWPIWAKFIISIPFIVAIIGIILGVIFIHSLMNYHIPHLQNPTANTAMIVDEYHRYHV